MVRKRTRLFATHETFWTNKTTWLGIAGILAAFCGGVCGQIPWPAAIAAMWTAGQTVNWRDACAKFHDQ